MRRYDLLIQEGTSSRVGVWFCCKPLGDDISFADRHMYSWVPNRGRVWNSHIGWTFTLKRINVGCGINVLGGNFPKMLIVGDGMFPSNV